MERAAAGRSAQAQRGRLGTLLVARQGRSPSGGLVTLLCAERRKTIWHAIGEGVAAGNGNATGDGGQRKAELPVAELYPTDSAGDASQCSSCSLVRAGSLCSGTPMRDSPELASLEIGEGDGSGRSRFALEARHCC